jgi:protein subunit release factor B
MTAPAPVPDGYRLPPDDDALLAECDVSYFRSSGPGGQHKNKTMSSVRLHHRPTGFVAIGKRERSQKRNLEAALERLRERIRRSLEKPKPRKRTKPTRQSTERRLEEKRRWARQKQQRSDPDWD